LLADIREFLNVFMKLYKEGYIKIEMVLEEEPEEYLKITALKQESLIDYMNENRNDNFKKLPKKEYYITTTKAGNEYYEKNCSD